MLIKNGSVYHEVRIEPNWDLRVGDGRIVSIGPGIRPEKGERVIDAAGWYVLPGLVDLHNHGLRHVMAQHDSLLEYSRLLAAEGVTACVPTLLGTVRENADVMRRGLRETDRFRLTPNLIGFRPEITYLTQTGAGAAGSLIPISVETTETLYHAAEGKIPIWDVSPELEGAVPFVRWCRQHGIITSMAHTMATIDEAREVVEAGLSLVTHFYDVFPVPSQTDPGVYPVGLADYVQVEDRLTVEIIPDGVHVHPYLVEKTLRCKGIERVAFVTDGVRGAGSPPGVYDGLYPGVQVEISDRGVRRTSDGLLAGSALTQIRSLANAVRRFDRSLEEASDLCSATPARVLGLQSKGRLAVGMDADIIVVSPDLEVMLTMVVGQIIYRAG